MPMDYNRQKQVSSSLAGTNDDDCLRLDHPLHFTSDSEHGLLVAIVGHFSCGTGSLVSLRVQEFLVFSYLGKDLPKRNKFNSDPYHYLGRSVIVRTLTKVIVFFTFRESLGWENRVSQPDFSGESGQTTGHVNLIIATYLFIMILLKNW